MSSSQDLPGLETTLLEDGLLLDWHVSPAELSQDSDGKTQIEIGGFFQDQRPGALRLPMSGVLIAIPEGEKPDVEVLKMEVRPLRISSPLTFNNSPAGVLFDEAGQVIGGAFSPMPGEKPIESGPVRLETAGVVRGVQLSRLELYPIISEGRHLNVVQHIQIRLRFTAPQPDATIVFPVDPILATVRSLVINPQHVAATRIFDTELPITRPSYLPEEIIAAIEVESTGLITVTSNDLQTIGFPIGSTDPNYLHLTRSGDEIAYQWFGDNDAIFEDHESLVFFAEPRFSRWSKADVYFLWQGESSGLRMDSRPANPNGLPTGVAWVETLAEVNALYTPDCYCAPIPAGRDGDRWVWAKMQRSINDGEVLYNFSIHLPSVDPAQTAALTLWLIGETDLPEAPDHRVVVSVNSKSLGEEDEEVTWDGKAAVSATLSIPAGMLQTGENIITLALPGIDGVDFEGAWLDAFSVRYALGTDSGGESLLFTGADTPQAYQFSLNATTGLRGYDVTDPLQPISLTDLGQTVEDPAGSDIQHRYWLATESAGMPLTHFRQLTPLQTGEEFAGVDYLIISPTDFTPALPELVALRESQGFSIAIEDIQAIYDTFGDGRPDPNALKAYLANAYSTWTDRPIYLLLVGDGTSDPKHYQTSSSATFIPPFLVDVDPWAGETASDNYYVTLDGDDNLPEMLIGRLPANSLAEAQTMVSKIVQYETGPEPGIWSGTASYIADNRDGSGNFPQLLESLITQKHSPTLVPYREYFDPGTMTPEEFHNDLENTWNFGRSLMVYTGHASIHQWAAENFIHLGDIPNLANGDRLPVLLELTCFTGSFQVPGFETFDEALLRHPTGGVVGAWGSTGLGISTGHHWLAEGFLEDTFSNPSSDLGSAALAGKLNLAGTGFYPDLIDTFTLLGDPATQFFTTQFSFMPFLHR